MKIHIVQKDDTLWKIAEKYRVDVEELKRLNSQLTDFDTLLPGMKIKLPVYTPPFVHHEPMMPQPSYEESQPHPQLPSQPAVHYIPVYVPIYYLPVLDPFYRPPNQ